MSIYGPIKNLGRSALLTGSLVAILTGCEQKANTVVVDINGDGMKDIITYNSNKQYPGIYISLNYGGSFEVSKIAVHTKIEPTRITVEDLNSDGIPDLSYALSKSSFGCLGSGTKYIVRGNGDGTFQNPKKVRD